MTAVLAVVVTRRRHPLEGLSLVVLGRLRRHGHLELLLVLPDGSKSMVPAAWTDLEAGTDAAGGEVGERSATLGSLEDLLAASELVSALLARSQDEREQAARQSPCKEDSHAACAAQSAARPGSGATPNPVSPASRTAGRGGGQPAGSPDRQSIRSNADAGDEGERA
ncbi:MAG TPA: hypothetical protein VFX16_35560 [Pseudonocardiaceae bacterium]|nr:hypothetical protein [Pseudonocardiaceae bacterium]